MNKVILIGRLVADPDTKTFSSGSVNATFRIAVQRYRKDANGNRESDYFTVVTWNKLAELVTKYLMKGRQVCVEGCIQNRSYEAQDGSKRYVTEIIAESVEFLGSREDKPAEAPAAPKAKPVQTSFEEVEDDDLPF